MHAMATAGLNDGRFLSAWTGLALAAMTMMFALIRSGWSRRLSDPSLAVPQLLVSIGFAAFAYGIAGLGQGVGLLMVALMSMTPGISLAVRRTSSPRS